MKRLGIFVIAVALIAALVGCVGGDGNGGGSYTLIVDFTYGGTVTVDDVPIPGKAILTYDPGTMVSLNATADAGYHFVNWTGDVETIDDANAASTTITMSDNYSVKANFDYVGPRTVIELDFATFFPATDFQVTMGFKEWAKAISECVLAETTKYTLAWNWYYPVAPPSLRTGVENGTYDVIATVPDLYIGVYPLWSVCEQAADTNVLPRKNALTMSMAVQALWENSSALQNEFAAAEPNVKVMLYWSSGPGYFLMTQGNSVTTLADFAGKTIRVVNPASGATITALGATPVSLGIYAVPEAFQAGTIQGILTPTDTPKGFGLVDYVQSCTVAPFGYQVVFFKLMNKATWDNLPAQVQTIFNEVNAKYTEYYGKLRTWGEYDGLAYMRSSLGKDWFEYDLPTANPGEYATWVSTCYPSLINAWIGGNSTRQDLWNMFLAKNTYYHITEPWSTWTHSWPTPPSPPTFP